jgi:hypothetical protein
MNTNKSRLAASLEVVALDDRRLWGGLRSALDRPVRASDVPLGFDASDPQHVETMLAEIARRVKP